MYLYNIIEDIAHNKHYVCIQYTIYIHNNEVELKITKLLLYSLYIKYVCTFATFPKYVCFYNAEMKNKFNVIIIIIFVAYIYLNCVSAIILLYKEGYHMYNVTFHNKIKYVCYFGSTVGGW